MTEKNGSKQLEIKKYPNRRYYDATRSQHLTLEQIRALIREGCDVRVTDSKTNADITAKVLAQIILELDEEKLEALPVALLQRLISVNDEFIKEFVDRYFNRALTQYLQFRQQMEASLRNAGEINPFLPNMAAWGRAMFDPVRYPATEAATSSAPVGSTAPEGAVQTGDLPAQVNKLQEQIARLEARLSAKEPKRKAGAGRKRRAGRRS